MFFWREIQTPLENIFTSNGVSRVSNAYGPTAEGGPPKKKIYTRCFFKELPKTGKSQILDLLLTGPRDPRYGSAAINLKKSRKI
jgi:hypothetical protein